MATLARRPAPIRRGLSSMLEQQAAGRSVSVADYIIEQIDAGVHPITAAGAAGVAPAEYTTWIREGQQVIARLNAGAVWETDFTPEQQDVALFAERAVTAHSQQVARLTVVSEQIARGGIEKKRVTTRTVAGGVVETTQVVERTLPDPDMVRWRLETLEPAVYGKRATLNLTVTDMTDGEVVADVVAERIGAIIDRFKAAAIDTTAVEVVE